MERVVYDRMATQDAKHWWYVSRRDVIAAYLRREAGLPADAQILEIGCGTGHNLAMLSKFGQVDAIEIDDAARAIASERLGRAVGSAPLPDLAGVPENHFDLIAILDVLEHVEDDAAALVAMARRLKPGGQILITVPAHQWLWSAHDTINHHHRRYSKPALDAVIRKAGLQHNGLYWFNSILFPLAIASRLASNVSEKNESADAPPSGIVNSAFQFLFGLERHLIGRVPMPIGLSLMTLVHKPAV